MPPGNCLRQLKQPDPKDKKGTLAGALHVDAGEAYFDGAKMPVWLAVISTDTVAIKVAPHQFDL